MPISVAMATFNGSRYLREQLGSIATQSLLPAELVVSDDGSSDDTLALVSSFAECAPFPVRLLPRDEQRGFADNFLHAARACRHDLIAFCDQDDIWLPHKLATAAQRMDRDASLLAMHRLTTTDEAMKPIGLWTQGIEKDDVFPALTLDPYINGWGNSMLFRRWLVTEIPSDHRPRQPEHAERPLSHDTWIYVLAAALGNVSHIAEPLVLYRQHGRNAIGVDQSGGAQKAKRKPPLSMRLLRERMVFYGHMAQLFGELARTPGFAYAAAAQAAAARYAERREPIAARFDIYDGPSLPSRLRAFLAVKPSAGLRLKSRVKDLLLGVAGLHTLLD